MTQTDEKERLGKSLKITVKALEECNAEYRVLGSVLIAAHVNRVFRRIGDLDLLIAKKDKDCVFKKLEREGFRFVKKHWGFFSWIEAHKKDYLGLSILLIGDFHPSYFSYHFLKIFELRIKSEYLKPTKYQFCGVSFVGIPTSSVLAGIKQAFLNPKRKVDNATMAETRQKVKFKTYGNINVYVAGVKIPFLYDAFSFLYNIYGGIRVMFGKKYEVW